MQHVVLVRDKVARIRRAKPLSGRVVRITWADDVVEIKDISPILANQRTLVRLRHDDDLFATLAVSADGDRLVWNDALAVTAGAIARLPQNAMAGDELRAIMAELNFTSEGLAALLGLSRRAITDYRGGAKIPEAVALSVRYLSHLGRM